MQPSTIDTGLTTLAIPTTTTVQTEEIVIEKPKDGAKIPNPDLCTVGTFVLSKNAYTGKQGDRWFFAFRIVLPKSHYFRWVLKVKFNKNVEKIIAFNFVGQPSNSSAKLWTFTAHGRNREIKGKGFVGVGIATVAQKLEEDNGEQPKGMWNIIRVIYKLVLYHSISSYFIAFRCCAYLQQCNLTQTRWA